MTPLAIAHIGNALLYALQSCAFVFLYATRRERPLGILACASACLLA